MAIPMLDLKKQHELYKSELEGAALHVLRSGSYILGERVRELEAKIAELCTTKYGIGVASGTDALILALMALGIGPGDEVITTPYTFFATAGAIHRVGAKSVFVDIEPDTYNIDVGKIEAAVTPRTRAIMPVHLFGQPADMDEIMAIAGRHGIPVIEDAAQSLGSTYHGTPVGKIGSFGCISFYPSKNLGCCGDAGMVVTDDDELAKSVRSLRVHGASMTYFHQTVGLNSRLDELQAALLLAKLPHLKEWSARREENAVYYSQSLTGLPISTPTVRPDRSMIYNQYVIRVPQQRDALAEKFKQHAIGFSVYYPWPLHLQPCFAYLGYKSGDFPEAEAAAKETLALPISPELTRAQQDEIIGLIREHYRH